MPADPFEERLRAGLGRLASEARVSGDAGDRLRQRAQREPMRRIGVVVASYAMVVAAAAALFFGTRFSGDGRDTAVLPAPPSTTDGISTTTTAPTTTTTPPTTTSPDSGAGTGTNPSTTPSTATAPTPPALGPGYSTARKQRARTPPVPPVPRVVRLEPGRHDDAGFERVVIEFDGGLPGYDVGYVSQVVEDGTGDPVPLRGAADLQITITPAQAHDDAGRSTLRESSFVPGFRVIQEVRLVSDFEGYVTIGVGTAGRLPFKVSEFSGPNRLVIDFAQAG
jgi:hypothetical protein